MKTKMNNHKIIGIYFLFAIVVMVILLSSSVIAATPSGATLTPISNQTAPTTNAQNLSAFAGNVTLVNIYGKSTTQAWQGYYGNVTGTIQLADASSNVLYNWSTASPSGEVFANTNVSVVWTNIQCFNFTANGTGGSETTTRGNTSRAGMNETTLAALYGITVGVDSDGVNQTFNQKNHAQFYANSFNFSTGQCPNTKIFNAAGAGLFDEALLYSPDTGGVIFTSLLQNDGSGFDGKSHDFEMLVLENGHAGDTAVTPYNFYVELH
jgi:hypothetical protein